ncbi:hypothetical protein SAMD00019534_108280, partial [Acytostelium subglobosum LB1]|uniref:hypothetical protein n=1 Tax=Acytostelium subglobosum LB1 TaxID=1410327 RepID=UPI00064508DE
MVNVTNLRMKDLHGFVNSNPSNLSSMWITLIDNMMMFEPNINQDMDYDCGAEPPAVLERFLMDTTLEPKLHPAAAYQYLKHKFKISDRNINEYQGHKQRLMERVDTQHPEFITHKQSFKQFKHHSIIWENSARGLAQWRFRPDQEVLDYSPCTNTIPSLPPLLITHIIKLIILDDQVDLDTDWLLMLSIVSKQFHGSVSTVLSNNVIKTLSINNYIEHIGSEFCLLRNPPLHIHLDQLWFLPEALEPECLERLESLIVPFSWSDDERIVNFHHVNAPNITHIKFVDSKLRDPSSNSSYMDDHTINILHDHNVKDRPSIQKIEYSFKLDSGSIPKPITPNTTFEINVNLENLGGNMIETHNDGGLDNITTLSVMMFCSYYQFGTLSNNMVCIPMFINLVELRLDIQPEPRHHFPEDVAKRLCEALTQLKRLETLTLSLPDIKCVAPVLNPTSSSSSSLWSFKTLNLLFNIDKIELLHACNGINSLKHHLDRMAKHLGCQSFNNICNISMYITDYSPYNQTKDFPRATIYRFNQSLLVDAFQTIGFQPSKRCGFFQRI